MKRTVKITIPRGLGVDDVKYELVDGEIIVSYDTVEEFKAGDFLINAYDKIFIYSGKSSIDNNGNLRLGSLIGLNAAMNT